MQRAISSLPLSGSWLSKLASCGYETVDDLQHIGIVQLGRELGVRSSEALEIVRVAKRSGEISADPSAQPTSSSPPTHPPQTPHSLSSSSSSSGSHPQLAGVSALELLERERLEGSIVTFSAGIDGMLGGGVALGKLTEFCGAPGLGKTQICIQLAVDVSIPEPLGGVGGEAVYIDTEGSFIVERVAEVAKAAVCHLKSMDDHHTCDDEVRQAARDVTLERVLSSIHLFRCHDYLELLATVNILSDFLSNHPQVRLVVVDSIAAQFRHGFTDMSKRNRLLGIISQSLIRLATSHHLAVVLTNQMTTRVVRGVRSSAHLVPALGESWGHASTVRVLLSWSGSERHATLLKSPTHKETTAPFVIMADGIRDPQPASDPSQTLLPSSQCVPLPEEDFEEDEIFCAAEGIMADMEDPAVWQGREEEGGGVRGEEGGGGRKGDAGATVDFVSVSRLHEASFSDHRERKGRKRPHPSDPEL